jgi:hypothetical protein
VVPHPTGEDNDGDLKQSADRDIEVDGLGSA